MTGRRPLRLALCILELPRLALILAAVSGSAAGAPTVALAAPQALFPLLAFFAWYDPTRYGSYLPVYAAGKAISLAALLAWLWGAAPAALTSLNAADPSNLQSLAAVASAALLDLAAGLLSVASVLRAARAERFEPDGREAGSVRSEDRPALVIDELPDDSGGA